MSRAELPLLFPSCTRALLVGPVQTTELGTTPEPRICQSLFMQSRMDSQGLVLDRSPIFHPERGPAVTGGRTEPRSPLLR